MVIVTPQEGKKDIDPRGAPPRATPPGDGTVGDGKRAERTERSVDLGLQTLRPRWRTRRIVFLALAAILLLLIVAGIGYWRLNAGLVKTDNAQTSGDLAPVSAQITGTVARIDITDNQFVKAGAVLVELDPTDYRLALDQAKANLAAVQAQVQVAQATLADQENQYRTGVSAARGALAATTPRLPQAQAQVRMDEQTTAAQVAQAQAGVATAQANVQSAQANEETARKTRDRDRQLLTQGAIAQQQVDTDTAAYAAALAQYRAAQEGLRQAQATLASAEANREQVVISQHAVAVNEGQIAQARAQFEQAMAGDTLIRERMQQLAAAEAQAAAAAQMVKTAQVNLDRTLIRAPADGWVTNRTVQIGQVVQPNHPMLSITIAQHLWVVANIKETQLANVRVGDPVRITVDVFRGRVFHGHVISITAASGSTTALLPPDNATGNFIKVVQLVAVRIALDPSTDPNVHLPVGVSAEVTIDTRHRGR
ncbi:MAG TPA: HlyD family secretion protein [bacterium]|nr:HlyD family secretion protein [bacterium]